ncbi:MAG: hypothetical protein HY721_09200 [Planctomycetes bacterium]|nr:hypothetical protein [Planctomycetota bacterium]
MRLQQPALALVSAALRHVRDAETLADPSNPRASLDQAYHLGGYGPECARKATLSIRWLDKAIGHLFGSSEDPLALATALDLFALRYQPLAWAARFPPLAEWSEQVRYRRTGSFPRATVQTFLESARKAVDEVVLGLWADGRLGEGGLP